METRVLSEEEKHSLAPDATRLVYKYILDRKISPDILEQALLQAVFFARVSHRCMDAKMFEHLLEKISECEGLPLFEGHHEGEDGAYRYC